MSVPVTDPAGGPYHYYDDCGAPESDDDVLVSEPWDVTCPYCQALM